MASQKIKFTLKDLYNRVWEKAVMLVAADYGLSDNGLKRICNRMNLPKPYRKSI